MVVGHGIPLIPSERTRRDRRSTLRLLWTTPLSDPMRASRRLLSEAAKTGPSSSAATAVPAATDAAAAVTTPTPKGAVGGGSLLGKVTPMTPPPNLGHIHEFKVRIDRQP